MYAAAGGASLAGRKARQHGRHPAPTSPHPHSPVHPAPTGVRAYSCQHWESRLLPPPRPLSAAEPSQCDLVEVQPTVCIKHLTVESKYKINMCSEVLINEVQKVGRP
ncbi:unnamed protein product [Pieris macdunnoughi]|uniref:Uncharacterized protein n=1 Tax=Pieris macdunnoughi TaxID=345717 RepID=A0A821QDM8_9NEOP|nr:unnamed protein product [Pieris macdunnoughi]